MTFNKQTWSFQIAPKVSCTNALVVVQLKFSETSNGLIDIGAQPCTRFNIIMCTRKQTNNLKKDSYKITTLSVTLAMTLTKYNWKTHIIPKASSTNALVVAHLKFSKTHSDHIHICAHIGTRFEQINKQTTTKNALKIVYTVAINWAMTLSNRSWQIKIILKVSSNVCTVEYLIKFVKSHNDHVYIYAPILIHVMYTRTSKQHKKKQQYINHVKCNKRYDS